MPFHSIKSYLDGPRAMTDGRVSGYHMWKMAQPGYMDPEFKDFGKFGYAMSPSREVAWDGTFSQPVLPLADPQSKHLKGTKFI